MQATARALLVMVKILLLNESTKMCCSGKKKTNPPVSLSGGGYRNPPGVVLGVVPRCSVVDGWMDDKKKNLVVLPPFEGRRLSLRLRSHFFTTRLADCPVV